MLSQLVRIQTVYASTVRIGDRLVTGKGKIPRLIVDMHGTARTGKRLILADGGRFDLPANVPALAYRAQVVEIQRDPAEPTHATRR